MKRLSILSSALLLVLLFVFTSINAESNPAETSYAAIKCIVDGVEFEETAGVKYKYLNKEFNVCSDVCLTALKRDPAKYTNEALHCPVCDEGDAKKGLSATHEDVKYYFCGNGCKKKFEADAKKFLGNYNK